MALPIGIRFGILLSLLTCVTWNCGWTCADAATRKQSGAAYYLKPNLHAGDVISDITYRVIATHGRGMEDNVWQVPATGTYTILSSDDPDVIKWNVSVRMDGKVVIQDTAGDYRDDGKTRTLPQVA